MSNLIAQLRADGTISLGAIAGTGTVGFVQSCYNRLNNGTDELIVLTSEASTMRDDLIAAGIDENAVVVCNEPKRGNKGDKSVKDLTLAFERRNAANPNALDKTFGSITIPDDGGITDADGRLVGFVVVSK